LVGNILATVCGFFFAVQVVTLRKIKDNSPGAAVIFGNYAAFLIFLPFWGAPWPSLTDVFSIFAMGVFQVGFSYYLYVVALPYVSALELVMITMLEPILTPIITFMVIGEEPGKFALLGGVIVIAGVIVWSVLKNRPKRLKAR
jgi:drug/metabolite transporter (DMT)-like permease